MDQQNSNTELFTTRVKAGRRVYHIDVKPTTNNIPYVSISEKKMKDDGTMERYRIMLMAEDVLKFQQSFNEVVEYLKANYPQSLTHHTHTDDNKKD